METLYESHLCRLALSIDMSTLTPLQDELRSKKLQILGDYNRAMDYFSEGKFELVRNSDMAIRPLMV